MKKRLKNERNTLFNFLKKAYARQEKIIGNNGSSRLTITWLIYYGFSLNQDHLNSSKQVLSNELVSLKLEKTGSGHLLPGIFSIKLLSYCFKN
jgi:hypothetical protein